MDLDQKKVLFDQIMQDPNVLAHLQDPNVRAHLKEYLDKSLETPTAYVEVSASKCM